ncbi:carbohydrate-selective porin, OprB family [mine drainage metagenome]|uniref:Carbohydrate-selective porin, OprB family n=1 Tax=mine drainage metagenome TaxID=410659 RepID=A0A1J5SVF7_9ZZZZ
MRFRLPGCPGVAFSPFGLALVLFASALSSWCQADTSDVEDTTARVQSTYNWQRHPAYPAAYSGPNSLNSNAETMYTFSVDAFLGFRPWKDGEVYFTPEVFQGMPFSGNLIGLAGFTNGEITRAAGPNPTLYRQKLFLRQTWNNGGGAEHVESDLNQMAGWHDKNRFVLTVGNFSTLDVFDPNIYAKDPRTQFMNWGNMTYAAYDYAADARGFGWGFAGEWYRDDWVLRYGRMTGPETPNGLPLDYAIGSHYGDQFEVEHAHTLHGRPGAVRLLGWRDRANLASFSDALAWLNTHPGSYTGPDALYAVRNGVKTKYGLGINIEQEVSDSTGFFMRTMKADGRTETYAFTEADASFSSGFLVKGDQWQRHGDTVGLSLMRNAISADRRRFLEAGGISFFIGDGKLNYRPEDIVEGFYSLSLGKDYWLTADYQRIQNPAYNADRGPIDVYALRFHLEL